MDSYVNLFVSIFHEKLIPWSLRNFRERLVVARPKMDGTELPRGVALSYKAMAGKRVLVRTRDDGPMKIIRARWPEDDLHEIYPRKLVCVLEGTTDYRTGENIITCGEGHFILLPPFIPNATNGPHLEGEHRKNGYCKLLQFIPEQNYIRCHTSSSAGEQSKDTGAYTVTHPLAIALFNQYIDTILHKKEEEYSFSLLTASFFLMADDLKNNPILSIPRTQIPYNYSDKDALHQIHLYIKANLRYSLTIKKVAHAMYMSPSQFTRFLRRETNKSFVEILTEHRMEEAKRLLEKTEWSVSAIAKQLGFKSLSYFNTFFVKNAQTTPGRYRIENRPDIAKK